MKVVEQIFANPQNRVAAIDEQSSITFGELTAEASQLAQTLGTEKQLILLECEASIDWLIAYTALLIGSHVGLLTPPGEGETRKRFEKQFRPNTLLLADEKYQPRSLHQNNLEIHPDLSLLLSTSGSTGSPKCVRLSRENIFSNAASICEYLQLTQIERGVVNLPTHYSYGLSIVNSHLYAGGTLLFTRRSISSPEFWDFCNQHGATSFAGVPHSYDLLSRIDFERLAPETLRYFTQAGGRLQEDKARLMAEISGRNGWRFYIMYGQTEASPRMAYLPPHDVLKHPESIGIAIPGGELSVLDENGKQAGDDVEGELCYRGPNVMMGYASSDEDLKLPKQLSQLKTGDLARRSSDGLFYITGRMSRFIKIFGNRIGLDEVEQMCVSAGHTVVATGIDGHLLILTRDENAVAAIGNFLTNKLKLPKHTIEVRHLCEYPVLSTGKIDYATLKSSIVQELAEKEVQNYSRATVKDAFIKVFGNDEFDDSNSFYDLGGDSLTYIHVYMDLEKVIPNLPENWIQLSIRELSARTADATENTLSRAPSRKRLSNIDSLRAIACILVVMYHVFGGEPDQGLKFSADSPWRAIVDGLDLLRMPLFTALAGMMYAAMPVTPALLGDFVRKRFMMLIVPAIGASLIYYFLRSAIGKEQASLLPSLLYGYLHLWYLYVLFFIMITFGAIDALIRPGIRGWLLLILGVFGTSWFLPNIFIFSLNNTIELAPFFIIGLLLYRNIGLLENRSLLFFAILVSMTGLVIREMSFFGLVDREMTLNFLAPISSAALVFVAISVVPRLRFIEWIGLYSYAIYLWHPLCNAAVRMVLQKAGIDNLALLFLVGTVVGVVFPIAIYKIASKSPAPFRNVLIGR